MSGKLESYFNDRFGDSTMYRGHHFFQHSRYTLENIVFVLKYLKDNDGWTIPPGDFSNYQEGGQREGEFIKYKEYNELCEAYQEEFQKKNNQFNSIKKHLFVDMESMGLSERVKHGRLYKIKITAQGNEMAQEESRLNLEIKWARAIGTTIEKQCPTFLSSLDKIMSTVKYISKDELIYFVSYLDYNSQYGPQEIAKLIMESRLNKSEYYRLKKEFKNESKKLLNNGEINKTTKKDYGNFSNSSTSLWNYLESYIYYQNDGTDNLKLRENITVNGNSVKFNRSADVKEEYIRRHLVRVPNDMPFDFHHIIPLFKAGTLEEKIMLDDWKNIVCIDPNTHAIVTRIKSDNIRLLINKDELELHSIYENDTKEIKLYNGDNALYNIDIIKKFAIDYNTELLNLLWGNS